MRGVVTGLRVRVSNRDRIVLATLDALARAGRIGRSLCVRAIRHYGIDTQAEASWNC